MRKLLILILISTIGFSQNCENSIWDEIHNNENDTIINMYFPIALDIEEDQLSFLDDCESNMSYTVFAPHPDVPTSALAPLLTGAENGNLIDYLLYYIYNGNLPDPVPQLLTMMDGNTALIAYTNPNIVVNESTINDVSIVNEICACNGIIYVINDLIWAPGFDLIENDQNYVIYPNPTRSAVNVSKIDQEGVLRLKDVNGRTLWSKKVNNTTKINISEYPSGLYFVNFQSNKLNFTEPILIN